MPMLHKYVHIHFSRPFSSLSNLKRKKSISHEPHTKTAEISHDKTRSSFFRLLLICAQIPVPAVQPGHLLALDCLQV